MQGGKFENAGKTFENAMNSFEEFKAKLSEDLAAFDG